MNESDPNAMPEWDIAQWFNTDRPLRLADLRGQVVLVHAFQMLCPGCVMHAMPQARQAHALYGASRAWRWAVESFFSARARRIN